jgi:glucose/arabinose dehydrogenase
MIHRRFVLSLIGLAALALAGCAPVALEPTVAPTATASPTQPAPAASPTPSATPTSPTEVPVTRMPEDSDTPEYRSLEPLPGDARLNRGAAFVNTSEVLLLESFPVQVQLRVTGALPTPCNQLRVAVAEPDAQNRIKVEVYSVVDPNVICIQVLADFDETFDLGSYPSGKYEVWVNGELAGEFVI